MKLVCDDSENYIGNAYMYISVVAGLQSVKYLYLSKVNLVHAATIFCITEGGHSGCFYPLDVLGESLDEKFVVLAAESTIKLTLEFTPWSSVLLCMYQHSIC